MAYTECQKAKNVAKELVNKLPELNHIDINQVYFIENDNDKATFYGRISKIPKVYLMLNNQYKFIMEISGEKVKKMNEAQYNLLIYHELRHIGHDFDSINKHDIEDFADILIRFGLHWTEDNSIPNILEMAEDELDFSQPALLNEIREESEDGRNAEEIEIVEVDSGWTNL